MIKLKCSKRFDDLPFAHRQPAHDGHCSLIHGHNWAFKFDFEARALDENGFVVDFGKLKWLREDLECLFDHTLVIAEDDPEKKTFLALENAGLAKLTVIPCASAEGIAKSIFERVNDTIREFYGERVFVTRVTVFEDGNNSATCEV